MGHIPSMVLDVDHDLRLALRAGPMRLMHKRRGRVFCEVRTAPLRYTSCATHVPTRRPRQRLRAT